MVSAALFGRMEAKPGKEKEVEEFLRGGLPIVQEEPATIVWFGLRIGPSTFIFDAFPNDAGQQAHLSGRVTAALFQKGSRVVCAGPNGREDRRACVQAPEVTGLAVSRTAKGSRAHQ